MRYVQKTHELIKIYKQCNIRVYILLSFKHNMENEYNVDGYTDEQLFQILDLNNPSDRELEAKILSMVRKYDNFGNDSGKKLSKFFVDIYNRFFETEEPDDDDDDDKEGFTTSTSASGKIIETYSDDSGGVKLTKTIDYARDKLNPLLKQTIKRIISIDSQYRNQINSPSTNFTFDLSEPLKDVVSLSLYSVQIPYTWYTVNSDFGGNFFYLKGNAPGIDNGLHDYKIAILSGNYTPIGLTTAVNESIQKMASIYTDVSFGQTKVIYNNGVNDQNSGTGKCALQIDITKVYNESNYSLKFLNWSTPTDDTLRLNTIAGYFGFNEQQYYCSSIYSYPFFSTRIKNETYPITTSKTSFTIVPYVGESYLKADISYTPITVTLGLTGVTQITVANMVNVLNAALIATNKFDNTFTNCTLIDIVDPSKNGYGQSYVKFNCKLNTFQSPIVRNLKLAAVFPYDTSGSLFYGSISFFVFSNLVTDISGNVICEFNELLSESPILQSSYDSSNALLTFRCNSTGYDNSYNNLTVEIPNLNYTLNSFINATNTTINNSVTSQPHLNANISLYSDEITSYLNIRTEIDNTYYNKDYSLYATVGRCNLPEIFGLKTTDNNDPANLVYNNSSYQFTTVAFNELDVIYIKPISNGNNTAVPFEISFNTQNAYSNGAKLANYLNSKIADYKDPNTGLYPFVGSNVTYSVNTGFTLNLNIIFHLNQLFYTMSLTGAIPTGKVTNIWGDLSFNSFYRFIDYSNNDFIIKNNTPIKDNEITIYKGVNDIFNIVPSNSVDVFNKTNNYSISVQIPDNSINAGGTKYAINELLNVINDKFVNTIAYGTKFSLYLLANGQSLIKVRFNINQVFTTKDYNLVFYDPFSFASCHLSGSRNNTSSSIQNATWDTTLGWLLGYRSLISYDLGDYVDIQSISGTTDVLVYYLITSQNVCVIVGDTNVSTNLYNYFLIRLDDYVQNHLNDGLVTITNQETSLDHGPFINVCDPVTGEKISRPADYGNPGVNYTAQQLYAFNTQVQSQIVKTKSYSKGPFVQDIFGILPVKTAGLAIGSVYVEFGGTLQNQQRLYFGPVNIHRMTIQLLNDRGNLVDLNNANWSFSFVCEQLYKNSIDN